ncbi:protein halfway [Culicoides brevitarsis]|uniref:protein halfway n=1 Tax=Culicoides brevitarsis TaxID=469753 RepID=UPI00307BA0A3
MHKFINSVVILIALILIASCSAIDDQQNNDVPSEQEPTTTQNSEDLIKLPVTNTCFYSEKDLCEEEEVASTGPKCNCKLHNLYKNAMFCCNVTDIDKALKCANANFTVLQHIHIRNASLNEVDFSEAKWNFFQTIAITDGNISRVTKEFSRMANLQCLNVSNNGLDEIQPKLLVRLKHLQYIDLSFNNLTSLPEVTNRKNLTINTRGNDNMICKSANEVLGKESIKFVDPAKTFCTSNSKVWYDTSSLISFSQLQRQKELDNKECPVFEDGTKCNCSVERVNFVSDDHVVFNARVDCSGLNLLTLPDKLPADTTTLNISNNSISSLVHFRSSPSYDSLQNFIADHNEITSMLDLEGSHFIQRFNKLSLRHNQLKSIPIYLLSNVLDRHPQGAEVFLEGNTIKCDCNAAKVLKIWLLARQSHIKDYDKIECHDGKPVLSLSENLCRSYVDWTDYIYLIIIAEVLLLIFLICKVTYDYYVFKIHGFLPWPASAIPKIPFCDWLCEN